MWLPPGVNLNCGCTWRNTPLVWSTPRKTSFFVSNQSMIMAMRINGVKHPLTNLVLNPPIPVDSKLTLLHLMHLIISLSSFSPSNSTTYRELSQDRLPKKRKGDLLQFLWTLFIVLLDPLLLDNLRGFVPILTTCTLPLLSLSLGKFLPHLHHFSHSHTLLLASPTLALH